MIDSLPGTPYRLLRRLAAGASARIGSPHLVEVVDAVELSDDRPMIAR